MFGFKEAAYWWNKRLVKAFVENGKDQFVSVKTENDKVSYWATTMDDCSFAIT